MSTNPSLYGIYTESSTNVSLPYGKEVKLVFKQQHNFVYTGPRLQYYYNHYPLTNFRSRDIPYGMLYDPYYGGLGSLFAAMRPIINHQEWAFFEGTTHDIFSSEIPKYLQSIPTSTTFDKTTLVNINTEPDNKSHFAYYKRAPRDSYVYWLEKFGNNDLHDIQLDVGSSANKNLLDSLLTADSGRIGLECTSSFDAFAYQWNTNGEGTCGTHPIPYYNDSSGAYYTISSQGSTIEILDIIRYHNVGIDFTFSKTYDTANIAVIAVEAPSKQIYRNSYNKLYHSLGLKLSNTGVLTGKILFDKLEYNNPAKNAAFDNFYHIDKIYDANDFSDINLIVVRIPDVWINTDLNNCTPASWAPYKTQPLQPPFTHLT